MKIIAGNSFSKNIQFICKQCACVYEVESKDDWNVRMNKVNWMKTVPEYNVECPNCGYIQPLGYDPDDLKGTDYENTICFWIPMLKKREDWVERFKIKPSRIGE